LHLGSDAPQHRHARRTGVRSAGNPLARLTQRPWLLLGVTLLSMPAVFLCGRCLSHPLQWLVAGLGAVALAAATSDAPSSHRRQTLTVVLLSIPIELAVSDGLGWYHYTFGTVPPWVPVGHGIVYFCALNLSASLTAAGTRRLLTCVLPLACLYAAASALTGHHDTVGVATTIILLAVTAGARSRRGFFAVMWLLVFWLEISGVSIGQWTWSSRILTTLPEGNPPAGIVGMYALADLLVMGLSALSYRRLPGTAPTWPRRSPDARRTRRVPSRA
jgi:hypothetical protein